MLLKEIVEIIEIVEIVETVEFESSSAVKSFKPDEWFRRRARKSAAWPATSVKNGMRCMHKHTSFKHQFSKRQSHLSSC